MPYCCGRYFSSKLLRNHLDNSYAHENEIECHWCTARWPTHDGRLRRQHEMDEHWARCQQCSSRFRYDSDLAEHVEDEHPPNYCYGCQRRFNSLNNLNQHLKSSVHLGKNVKCPWCTLKFTNLTGVCLHLESGACASNINREKINDYCRQVDRTHIFTNKQIEWHSDDDDDESKTTTIATKASWDGDWYRCYFCGKGFARLSALNQHLASPAHQQKTYHCPRCKKEYKALSALINHLESESCGAFRFTGNANTGFNFVSQLKLGQ